MPVSVYYDLENQVIPVSVSFTNSAGVLTDPASVVLVVTDPHGNATTYNYAAPNTDPNEVVKDGTGKYHINLMPFGADPVPPSGLWTYNWLGAGGSVANGFQVFTGTFRVLSFSQAGLGMTRWYCSMEELKSRLSMQPDAPSYNKFDYEIQLVMQTVTDWITEYCGRHFYQVHETRTFRPENVWSLMIDDIVTAESVDLDYDGDGVYEVHWVEDRDYQLLRYQSSYNTGDLGVARPRNQLQVTNGGATGNPAGGQWLPWLWPFTRQNRVSITGTWGWPDVPPNVTQAALYIAAEMFKSKDSPFGVAGIGELGIVKIQASPWVVELLRPYINVRKKVGV